MNLMGKHFVSTVRVALGTIFVYAGVLKAGDPIAFAGNIGAYNVLPYAATYAAAAVLPWLEMACGLLLIIGWRVKAAAGLVVLLNLIFMVALASAVARGLDIDCGCFKQAGGSKTSAWQALLRDAGLLAMAVISFIKAVGRPSPAVCPPLHEIPK